MAFMDIEVLDTTTVVVDTTATKLIELTCISGTANTTYTFKNAVIEMVKL